MPVSTPLPPNSGIGPAEARVRRRARGVRVVGLGASLTFVATVGLLPLWQPGYDARRQLISELAAGPRGGILLAAFVGLAFAIAAAAVGLALRHAPRSLVAPLLMASVCMAGAGFVPLQEAAEIHVGLVAIGFGLACAVIAAWPIAVPPCERRHRTLSWSLGAAMIASLGLAAIAPFGVVQRAAAALFVTWLALCVIVTTSVGSRDEQR